MQCFLLKELNAEPEVNVQNSAYCTVCTQRLAPVCLNAAELGLFEKVADECNVFYLRN